MLTDVPAVPEGIIELPVAITPDHVRKRLTNGRPGRHGPREYGVGLRDLKRENHGRATDRGRGEHTHLGKLVSDVQQPVAEPQLNRHQPAVWCRDPVDLLGTERVAVEHRGTLCALNNDMWSDWHQTPDQVRVAWLIATQDDPRRRFEQDRMTHWTMYDS